MAKPFSLTLAALMNQGQMSLAPYGLRNDESAGDERMLARPGGLMPLPKGRGFLGALLRPDGAVSTELSAGMNVGGTEQEIPLLVPTLTKDEVNHLLTDGTPTDAIYQKAHQHALQRVKAGQNPFATPGELRMPINWGKK